jgi:hypothetical protein
MTTHSTAPNPPALNLQLNSLNPLEKTKKKPKNLCNKKNLPTKKKEEKKPFLRKSHNKTKNQPTKKKEKKPLLRKSHDKTKNQPTQKDQ